MNQHTLKDGTILKVGQKYSLGDGYNWVQITSITDRYFKAFDYTGNESLYSKESNWLYYFNEEERTVNEKLEQAIQEQERHLKAAKQELKNHNLTDGQSRLLHVEIEKLRFSLKTLKFIKNDTTAAN